MKYYLFDHFLNCHLGRGGVLNGKFITQEQPKKKLLGQVCLIIAYKSPWSK